MNQLLHFLHNMTLEKAAQLSEIGSFVLILSGVSIWGFIKAKANFMRSRIVNIFRREYWIWSHLGAFYRYTQVGRKRWDKCHDSMGELKTDAATLGDAARFDKWGLFEGDGLTPLDHERNEELQKKHAAMRPKEQNELSH